VAVVKSGVFAIIRVTYFCFGALIIRGSYAQYVPMALTAFTIVFGCSMALKEKNLKRRLAYSTVSNLSYILFGALLLTPQGLTAGLMHLVFHALMKITLFLTAGVYNIRADIKDVRQLRGINSVWPDFGAVFALGGLAMTGIPPFIGFISKFALADAAFKAGGLLPALGTAALLISSLLTGIYLMVPVVMMYTGKRPKDGPGILPVEPGMRLTLYALSVMVLALSFYSMPLISYLTRTASSLV